MEKGCCENLYREKNTASTEMESVWVIIVFRIRNAFFYYSIRFKFHVMLDFITIFNFTISKFISDLFLDERTVWRLSLRKLHISDRFFFVKKHSHHVSTTSKPPRFEQWTIGVYKSTPFSRTIIVQSCYPAKWPSISSPVAAAFIHFAFYFIPFFFYSQPNPSYNSTCHPR